MTDIGYRKRSGMMRKKSSGRQCLPTQLSLDRVSFLYISLSFYLGATYHFRFRHCHSVTRRFPSENGIFFIYIFLFRKIHITSVSVTVTVSQEGFRVNVFSFVNIVNFTPILYDDDLTMMTELVNRYTTILPYHGNAIVS